jgi:hypothetical protein
MVRNLTMIFGATIAVVLVIAAVWLWVESERLAARAPRPDAMRWAARCLAVAAAAGAQTIILSFVLGPMYRRPALHEALRLTTGLICCIAAVSAAALGLAARG